MTTHEKAMVIFHSYGKLRLWYLNSYGKSLRIIIQTMSSSINGNILRIFFEHILNTHELMNIYGSVSKPCTPGEHQNSW
jgi:hypothetical protein